LLDHRLFIILMLRRSWHDMKQTTIKSTHKASPDIGDTNPLIMMDYLCCYTFIRFILSFQWHDTHFTRRLCMGFWFDPWFLMQSSQQEQKCITMKHMRNMRVVFIDFWKREYTILFTGVCSSSSLIPCRGSWWRSPWLECILRVRTHRGRVRIRSPCIRRME